MGLIRWGVAKAAGAAYSLYASASDEIAKQRRIRLSLTDGQGWSDAYGREGAAGKPANLDSAMKLSAFAACVRANAQAIGMMPLPMYEKQSGGDPIAIPDHQLAPILAISPNADQTSVEYWESVVAWQMTQGNACSEISRGAGDRITALQLLPGCSPVRNEAGDLVFRYYDRGKREELPREKVFHVKGFGFGGDSGVSVIRYAVESLSTGLAAQETAGKLFSNGMHLGGVLKTEQTLTKEQRDQLQGILDKFVSSERAGKILITESGLDFSRVQLSPHDAQLLEQQRFTIEEICRWCGTPPIVIGHSPQGQTMWGTGVEQIIIAWLALGLNPPARRIEKRIVKQLIRPGEQGRVYAEFNREAIMQMDSAAKATFLSSVTQNGLMTRNEGRAKLNMPRSTQPNADVLTAQTSLAPLDRLGGDGEAGQKTRAMLRAWLLGDDEGKQHDRSKAA